MYWYITVLYLTFWVLVHFSRLSTNIIGQIPRLTTLTPYCTQLYNKSSGSWQVHIHQCCPRLCMKLLVQGT